MVLRSLLLILLLVYETWGQTTFYVAPWGNDSNSGTDTANALRTPQVALAKVTGSSGGYTIYLRGGIYFCSTQIKPPKAGVAGNVNKLWAYPGEKPILDFTGFNDRGVYITKDYWHVKGIEVRNCGSNGICVSSCGYVTIEGCEVHDCALEGIKITGTSTSLAHDILVLNCDSYRNYDAVNHGENADGFAAKTGAGSNIVFRGCRAWYNSDDGWDFYSNSTGNILIDSCWAFRNGVNLWNDPNWQGDGDGFKLGGAGTTAEHIVRYSVAFDNMISGFAQNHANAGQTIFNCTGYRNKQNNFSFYETPTGGVLKKHVLKNCLSYGATDNIISSASEQVTNSWQGFIVRAEDFLSLDTSLALKPRNADYTLPNTSLFRLAPTSSLIDAGTNIGLPFVGVKPDLGAFEYNSLSTIAELNNRRPQNITLLSNYPNPFNPITRIVFQTPYGGVGTVTIYDALGRRIAMLFEGTLSARRDYEIVFNASQLSSGMYYAVFQCSNVVVTHPMVLMK
ncbi:MAG: right-handed parallel beta-helix repeat-containing protein [Bacteroidetes bacterium]|nr:right-handed parallel beta-helix repeat-containing protein [Bacteroidota bacterium]